MYLCTLEQIRSISSFAHITCGRFACFSITPYLLWIRSVQRFINTSQPLHCSALSLLETKEISLVSFLRFLKKLKSWTNFGNIATDINLVKQQRSELV